jgi:hypothetical protein
MPGDNRFRFDDSPRVPLCGPITAEKSPEHSIPDSQLRTRIFSLEYAQLLTERNDLQAENVAGTEEEVEEGEEANKKGNRSPGFMA